MDNEFDIVKIEKVKHEDKEYKKNIKICGILGIITTLISLISLKINGIIINNGEVKDIAVYGICLLPVSFIILGHSVIEIVKYNKFKKENEKILKKK